ncbi:hypothetical protein CUMW_206110 [Citrus unshiu]|uniref:KAT8 regulatory NSL complex subunit 2 n=1 Tax=Citrus unshiu TaxID=55188 RepID=A0A2H5Q9L5_CITUN|nr:hypothetical protein CUMW_206110 [Citrus unshiu]
MEELRSSYRKYYWEYGKSPYKEDNKNNNNNNKINENSNNNNNEEKKDIEEGGFVKKCGMAGCKTKAMPMTRFCHLHILSDSKQKLYKGCSYVTKSGQTGPILCGKPILRSTVPSLCPMHFQKAERHVARALKKAGLNVTSPSKVAPKLHVVVAEYVRQIQTKRRAAQKADIAKKRKLVEALDCSVMKIVKWCTRLRFQIWDLSIVLNRWSRVFGGVLDLCLGRQFFVHTKMMNKCLYQVREAGKDKGQYFSCLRFWALMDGAFLRDGIIYVIGLCFVEKFSSTLEVPHYNLMCNNRLMRAGPHSKFVENF